MNVTILLLLQAAYLLTPEIGVDVAQRIGAVLLPISKILIFTGQGRLPSINSVSMFVDIADKIL